MAPVEHEADVGVGTGTRACDAKGVDMETLAQLIETDFSEAARGLGRITNGVSVPALSRAGKGVIVRDIRVCDVGTITPLIML